jgi:hypothetical protein
MSEGSYIRGAGAIAIAPRRLGSILGVGAVIVLAAITVLLVVLTASADSAAARLHRYGVPVQATVTSCTGISSGIGMGIEFYQCRGTFALAGATSEAQIQGSRTKLAAGTSVAALVVPGDPGTLTLARSARSSSGGASDYAGGISVGAVTVVAGAGLLLWRRRSRRPAS